MKKILEFYYNIRINELHSKEDYYFFNINDNEYIFKPIYEDVNRIYDRYEFTLFLTNMINTDRIIINKHNSPFTIINNIPYVLIFKNNNRDRNFSLVEISNISNISNFNYDVGKTLERNNWEILWGNKIDYYEVQINENKKKYPLIRESFDYFIGLGENAISYLSDTKREDTPTIYDRKVISHNNLSKSLYDPLNIILDHKSRDIAEYIKFSFFNNNYNIFRELDEYFKHNYYSKYGIRVLFSRLLYPSFYFDLYDDIISGKSDEKKLNKILDKTKEYESFLYSIYIYLSKYYDIPFIEWLKKQGY